jgi:hypothetical protein
MIPKKPAPDLIPGGNRFSEKIMLKQESWTMLSWTMLSWSRRPHAACLRVVLIATVMIASSAQAAMKKNISRT